MKPIPPDVAASWSATWGAGVYPARPWWLVGSGGPRRTDGIVPAPGWLVEMGRADPRGLWDGKEPYEDFMARVDAEHPLPAPPPMPGQVWRWAEGDETMIVRVAPAGADGVTDVWRVWTGLDVSNRVSALVCPRAVGVEGGSRVEQWPPPGAVLVAGPSPHGLNVPWSGS